MTTSEPTRTPARPTFRSSLCARPRAAGVVVAFGFWVLSLGPSMLPRGWLLQGAISAACLLVGYGVGVFAAWAARSAAALARRNRFARVAHPSRRAWLVAGVVALAIALPTLVITFRWQNEQRSLVRMPAESPFTLVPMLLTTGLLVVVLTLLVRLVNFPITVVRHRLTRWIPDPFATLAVAIVAVVLGVGLARGVLANRTVNWLNERFAPLDETTPDGIKKPSASTVSGGPGSLAPWKTLGRQGRVFVASAPTADELAPFANAQRPQREPIRVYVGLESAPTPRKQAELAVRELERTGAFDRAVLCVATTTGSGWVNPAAAEALEYLHAGNTAIVAMQYSYFPSFISFLVDEEEAAIASRALNDAVFARWSQLPPDRRPQLVVYGESLGSFGTERAYQGATAEQSAANFDARTQGALLVGPVNANPVWGQFERARLPNTPAWRPSVPYANVRFENTVAQVRSSPPGADAPVLYLQHASDPVTWWNMETLWSRPDWVNPTGPDVSDHVTWTPFVTWLQMLGDLADSYAPPPGHGHDFSTSFGAAWEAVAPAPGWTTADAARLDAVLASR